MSFQSLKFALFLLLTLCAYYAAPLKLRKWVLLLVNAVFFLWADLTAGIWLAVSIVTTWAAALLLGAQEKRKGTKPADIEGHAGQNKKKPRQRIYGCAVLLLCLLVNLGLLVMFKYLPVWDGLINAAWGRGLKVVRLDVAGRLGLAAPLGISFYTLQAVGYLADVFMGKYSPERNLARYAVFVAFFPTILSGPIERGDHFLGQLDRIMGMNRRELLNYDRIAQGLISVLFGFFLKMVIADRVSVVVNYLYSVYENGNSFTMLVAALFYSVQIYCDFYSYSCIAAGVARLMGFSLIRNFRQPYFAAGISDFWRRWHISLSSWLRDYVYIPLGGSRRGVLKKYGNILCVFLISGLWHGGAPNFLVWGILHGVCQILEDRYKRMKRACLKGRQLPFSGLRRLIAAAFTFLLVSVLWIFFRSDSLKMAKICLINLFTGWRGFCYVREFAFAMGLEKTQMLLAAAFTALLALFDIVSERQKKEPAVWIYEAPLAVRWLICIFLIVSVAVFGMYGPGFDASSFIYVNF